MRVRCPYRPDSLQDSLPQGQKHLAVPPFLVITMPPTKGLCGENLAYVGNVEIMRRYFPAGDHRLYSRAGPSGVSGTLR